MIKPLCHVPRPPAVPPSPLPVARSDEMREFMVELRRALLLLVRYIERRYHLDRSS